MSDPRQTILNALTKADNAYRRCTSKHKKTQCPRTSESENARFAAKKKIETMHLVLYVYDFYVRVGSLNPGQKDLGEWLNSLTNKLLMLVKLIEEREVFVPSKIEKRLHQIRHRLKLLWDIWSSNKENILLKEGNERIEYNVIGDIPQHWKQINAQDIRRAKRTLGVVTNSMGKLSL
jgi:hypothetical protein